MKILLRIIISAVVAFGLSYVLKGVHINSFVTAFMLAIVLGLLNIFVKPILIILTLPITIFTLGLFLFTARPEEGAPERAEQGKETSLGVASFLAPSSHFIGVVYRFASIRRRPIFQALRLQISSPQHCPFNPSLDKFQLHFFRNQSLFPGPSQELANGLSARRAVIERKIVYIHPNESIRPFLVQTSG